MVYAVKTQRWPSSPDRVVIMRSQLRLLFSRILPASTSPGSCLNAGSCRINRTFVSSRVDPIALFNSNKLTYCRLPQKASLMRRSYCSDETNNASSFVFKIENDEDFTEKVINSSIPVLVDFYADWCGPCQMMAPRIEAKVVGRQGQVCLAKVNVDYAADLAMDYEVRAVPTVIAFKNGEEVGRFEGDHGDAHLEDFINELLTT